MNYKPANGNIGKRKMPYRNKEFMKLIEYTWNFVKLYKGYLPLLKSICFKDAKEDLPHLFFHKIFHQKGSVK